MRSTAPRHVRVWLFLAVAGILFRFVISLVSLGTNDAAAWIRFGDEVRRDGLLHTYQVDPDFNHPPLPGYWAAACASIAGNSGIADSIFTNAFKLPAILADALGAYLLWRIWRVRAGPAMAAAVAALFAWSLDAILVSGFHCNTDSVVVALCLLSVYLIEDKGRFLWAGLALGAAINVKIIPVLLIPALALSLRRRRDLFRFLAGLGVWALPFVPALVRVRGHFVHNVLRYNSWLDRWGIDYFLLHGRAVPTYQTTSERWAAEYYFAGKYVVLALLLAWAVAARIRGRWDRYEVCAATFSIFLVFASGFGLQYTVLPGLFLFAVRPAYATAYGAAAGVFLAMVYHSFWTGAVPFYSQFNALLPPSAAAVGLVAWSILLAYLATVVPRPARAGHRAGAPYTPPRADRPESL